MLTRETFQGCQVSQAHENDIAYESMEHIYNLV